MTVAVPRVDAADYRIGALLARRIWRLTYPYWARRGAWRGRAAMALLLASVGLISFMSVQSSYAMKHLTDAVIAKDSAAFRVQMLSYILLFGGAQLLPVIMSIIDTWLNRDWRVRLSARLVDQYLARRAYYDIALTNDIDNPDQRIQENVSPFTSFLSTFPRVVLGQLATVGAAVAVFASIDTRLLAFMIAFYHGEAAERRHILQWLARAARANAVQMYYYAFSGWGRAASSRSRGWSCRICCSRRPILRPSDVRIDHAGHAGRGADVRGRQCAGPDRPVGQRRRAPGGAAGW